MRFWREVAADFQAPLKRDPAAGHWLEVLLAYPGLHAVVAHRLIHRLEKAGMPIMPRVFSSIVRAITGIDIHPAAVVGPGLFIDHGTGVVIGSTTVIGEDVTIYQGVTLGGTSLAREKRHPTIGNRVTVGVGASVLGDITVGDDARIGAGAVVVKNVEAGATMVGIPARAAASVGSTVATDGMMRSDTATKVDMPDPQSARIAALEETVSRLSAALEERTGR